MSAAWGESSSDGEWSPTGPDWVETGPTVSNGVSVMLNYELFKTLTHHPIVVGAIQARAQRIADLANAMAQWEGAEYIVETQNDPNTTRARCKVKPGNMAAVLDDNYHGTLLKAYQSVGSDPKGGNR